MVFIFLAILSQHFRPASPEYAFSVPLYIVLSLLSVMAHEAGHLCVLVKSQQSVNHVGILLFGVIPCGAYVNYNENANSRVRLRNSLCGVLMNVLMLCVCLTLRPLSSSLTITLEWVAISNVLLVIINLIPAKGHDGEEALSALLGVKSISKLSDVFLKSREKRNSIMCLGKDGAIIMALFLIVRASNTISVVIDMACYIIPIIAVAVFR